MGCANTGMQYIIRMQIVENSFILNSDSNRHWVTTQKRQLVSVPCMYYSHFVQLGYSALVGLGVSSTANVKRLMSLMDDDYRSLYSAFPSNTYW